MPTDLMEPTIPRGAEIEGDFVHFFEHEPQRWDIVSFVDYGTFTGNLKKLRNSLDAPEIEGMDVMHPRQISNMVAGIYQNTGMLLPPRIEYIKRVIGLPGETIRLVDNGILIDGTELDVPEELRQMFSTFPNRSDYTYGAEDCPVPDRFVFLIGDNLRKGRDSRHIGPVFVENLTALIRYESRAA